MQVSGRGEHEEGQASGNEGIAEKTPGVVDPSPHAYHLPVHGEKVTCAVYNNEVREDCLFGGQDCLLGSKEVGPVFVGNFKSGSGESVGRPKMRANLGHRGLRAQVSSPCNRSPDEMRPKKKNQELNGR
ncbi:hypothetical protein Hanom_Chr12g01074441 [Helianthus anomalus]